ncbi:hypothetical protein BFG57_13185 [Bacillus solimangrovi]|uniref:DUF2521 domain-containing protein n=2 Tax=Bacillus solimangrovi TaxID=1305675 RepID=A0A1E5LGN1_9BACI|nr:hypothetical protein BFG57_13185 [Bacillus solimangrovi]
MEPITSLDSHRKKRSINFERKLLRELSLKELCEQTKHYFAPFFLSKHVYQTAIEDTTVEFAIEAYLLGAEMSRFGYYGESIEKVRKRSNATERELTSNLYDYVSYWYLATTGNELAQESLYIACENFMYSWWEEGFSQGVRKYRLRLHH